MKTPFESTVRDDAPDYIPSETAELVIQATAEGPPGQMRVLIVEGSRGEGKSSCCLVAAVALAHRLVRDGYADALPLRVALIRDTTVNLRRTTVASIEELQRKGMPVEWRDGQKEALISFDRPYVHAFLLGLERPEDYDKLQGFSCGMLIIEEPAPAAGLSSGLPDIALGMGVTCLRQPGMPFYRVLIPMNPGDRDQWVYHVKDRLEQIGVKDVVVHHARFQPGEKSEHFRRLAEEASGSESGDWLEAAEEFDRYRERNRAFLESVGRGDLVSRLVEGVSADAQVGEPVVPMFSDEHVVKGAIDVFRTLPILRMWDNEPCPACVLGQALPDDGGFNVLGSSCMENSTVQGLIQGWLLPFMHEHGLMAPRAGAAWGRGPRGGFTYQDVGDRTLLDTQLSAGEAIRSIGGVLMPAPVEWDERRAAAIAAFSRVTKRGRRFVQLEDESNKLLIQGLRGRFRYPKDIATGRIIMTAEAAKRHSSIYSHPCDALFYGLAWKFPAAEWLRRHQRAPVPRVPMKRAGTYMGI